MSKVNKHPPAPVTSAQSDDEGGAQSGNDDDEYLAAVVAVEKQHNIKPATKKAPVVDPEEASASMPEDEDVAMPPVRAPSKVPTQAGSKLDAKRKELESRNGSAVPSTPLKAVHAPGSKPKDKGPEPEKDKGKQTRSTQETDSQPPINGADAASQNNTGEDIEDMDPMKLYAQLDSAISETSAISKYSPEELEKLQRASVANLKKIRNMNGYFSAFRVMPAPEVPITTMDELRDYLGVEFELVDEKTGTNTGTRKLVIKARNSTGGFMRIKTPPAWIVKSSPLKWGSYKDELDKEHWMKYDTNGEIYNNVRKAKHEIMLSTQLYQEFAYGKELLVNFKGEEKKKVIMNIEFIKFCIFIRHIEYQVLKHLVDAYITAGGKDGVAEGVILHKCALHTSIVSIVKAYAKKAAKKQWKDLIAEPTYYSVILHDLTLEVGRSPGFSSTLIRADKLTRDVEWDIKEEEFYENVYLLSAKRPVFRYKGAKETEPSPYIRQHEKDEPNLMCMWHAAIKDPSDPDDSKKTLGGNVYDPPVVTSVTGVRYDPMIKGSKDWRARSGTIGFNTLDLGFQPYTKGGAHLTFKWVATCVVMDSQVANSNVGDEDVEVTSTWEGPIMVRETKEDVFQRRLEYEDQEAAQIKAGRHVQNVYDFEKFETKGILEGKFVPFDQAKALMVITQKPGASSSSSSRSTADNSDSTNLDTID
jgi:hypothetical protein